MARVAVVGLGRMGREIARRLERDEETELVVYNRSEGPADEFAQRGATVAATPREAGREADVCIVMVADDRAARAVVLGDEGVLACEHAHAPQLLVEMSTLSVAASSEIAERAEQLGVGYLRAPVSGNPGAVAAGKLTILVSGPTEAFDAATPLLHVIGPTVTHLGPGEEARVAKLALNLMVAGMAELLSEALLLATANGIPLETMLTTIGNSALASPFVKYKGPPLLADDYTSTFTTKLMRKDLGLILDCAAGVAASLPVTETVTGLVDECIEAGMGELDFMALFPHLRQRQEQQASAGDGALRA